MRRTAMWAAFVCLVVVLLAWPAVAAAGPARMPPNDLLLIKALQARGKIPRTAGRAQQMDMLRSYLQRKLGAKPEDRAMTARNLGGLTLRGRTPWGRAVALAPGAMTDHALVILVEFDPADHTPGSGEFAGETFAGGPSHGEIAPPARDDNSTFWPGPADKGFGTAHYRQMLFGKAFPIYGKKGELRGRSSDTMRNYYLEMSKGTHTVTGAVRGWVEVPYPESWYGRDGAGGTDGHTGPVWRVAEDAVDALAAANPGFDWTAYDRRNPFGIAGPDPDVPDGYVDHLVLVHAGVDQSAGGGGQGDDSIWAHSWWVDSANGLGPVGAGGHQVDAATSPERPDGVWIGPYTINPEDGGIGVFCHEFGHDLGLPDQYDTTYAGESPSGFWTLMASGSWAGKKWGLGTRPAPMNAWDKMALGYIAPRTVGVGGGARYRLQPAATGAAGKVAVKVALPPAWHETALSGADDPHNPEFWSGMGNDLDSVWTVWDAGAPEPGFYEIAVPVSGGDLTFESWYEIEDGYDYGFVQVSTDGGATWTSLAGDHTVDAGGGNQGLSGASGGGVAGEDEPQWETETYDLDDHAGQSIWLRFRYMTDSGVSYRGWEVTDVAFPDGPSFAGSDSGYLDPDTTWQPVHGAVATYSTRYYIAEYRSRAGFDRTLANVYNLSTYLEAEFFPYNAGLHLIYRDTFWEDNNVGVHPGEGGWMVVDAHPVPAVKGGVDVWRSRIQVRDAAFSTQATPPVWLTPWLYTPEALRLSGRRAQPVFDDAKIWWFPWAPDAGVLTEPLGVRMQVDDLTTQGLTLRVTGAGAGAGHAP